MWNGRRVEEGRAECGVSLTLCAACARDETRRVQSGVDVELLSFAVRVAFEVFYNGIGSTQGHSPRKLRCGHTPPRIKPRLNRTQYSLHHSSTVHSIVLSLSLRQRSAAALFLSLSQNARARRTTSATLSLSRFLLFISSLIAITHTVASLIARRLLPGGAAHTHRLFSVPPPSSSSTFSQPPSKHTHTHNNRRAHAIHGSADPPARRSHTHTIA